MGRARKNIQHITNSTGVWVHQVKSLAILIRQMGNGVKILGERTKPCYIRQEGQRRFRIILKQGLNRQIRRMCDYLGYKVTKLKRIRIMNIILDQQIGKWRDLSKKEMAEVNRLIADSSKTYED